MSDSSASELSSENKKQYSKSESKEAINKTSVKVKQPSASSSQGRDSGNASGEMITIVATLFHMSNDPLNTVLTRVVRALGSSRSG